MVENKVEAIDAANESEFGLGASVWTGSFEQSKRFVSEIQSGVVFVNEMTKSDPRIPFGGIKKSKTGRELSKYGLKDFVNIKSTNIYGV